MERQEGAAELSLRGACRGAEGDTAREDKTLDDG